MCVCAGGGQEAAAAAAAAAAAGCGLCRPGSRRDGRGIHANICCPAHTDPKNGKQPGGWVWVGGGGGDA